MISSLQPYRAMKDSGIEWLGEIPEHWELERGKNLFTKAERPVRKTDQVVTCFRDGTVTLRRNRRTQGFTESLKEFGYQGIRVGDLVIHAMDAFAGAVGVADSDGKGTPVYAVCKPKPRANAYYHSFVIREMARRQWILALATGIRERSTDFRFGAYANQRVPLPPLPEQDAIVRFIDYVDRRIRRYIRAKQKLIKLLEEQKQAIIHRTVTRGLNPDAPLKDSGVEWLGQVPEHWEVVPLKFLVPQVTVGIVIQPAQLYVPIGVPCLRSLNISSGKARGNQLVYITPESNAAHRKSQIFAGDIVIVRTGQAGVAAIVPPEFDGANCIDLLIVRSSERLISEYLLTYLNSWSAKSEVEYYSVGAIQANYNTTTLANLRVPTPPIAEQRTTLIALAANLEPLDATITRAKREIDLLNEYRTRLIADVVTGKLDVREAAASLPDGAVDPEEADELPPEIDETERDEPVEAADDE